MWTAQITGWWFQPIWKIFVKIGGENETQKWTHHLLVVDYYVDPANNRVNIPLKGCFVAFVYFLKAPGPVIPMTPPPLQDTRPLHLPPPRHSHQMVHPPGSWRSRTIPAWRARERWSLRVAVRGFHKTGKPSGHQFQWLLTLVSSETECLNFVFQNVRFYIYILVVRGWVIGYSYFRMTGK